MNYQNRNMYRYQEMCGEFEERFGEAFWMPRGLGLSLEDAIYAIKRILDRGVLKNGYEAFGLEPPHQLCL